ncbi:uncharacterized protein LOC141595701 [Silene latifolia]|uniref:uncharacterized protein LOC141595701 n=1 Tax=Silene latifolia TaxID=37657 RepID=UPI003D780EBA
MSSLSDTAVDSVLPLKNNAEIPKFPDISRSCEVAVPYEDLITMLGSLLQQAPYQVLVEITENTATLQAGQDDETWTAEYDMHTVAGRQGTEPGKIYRAMFEWAHDEWLDNTVHLDKSFVVSLHTEGPTYIVLRFILGDFGYLEYIREPSP